MANYWKLEGIPHKGWTYVDIIDVREDGRSEWETEYETCMMCGNEKIRYVHIVEHKEVEEYFRVGCICAEKMTNDYVNPQKREKNLRNRASRRMNWVKKEWKISIKGNYYLKVNGKHLLIYKDKKTGKYKIKIGEDFINKLFENLRDAKNYIFDKIGK